jgi:dihydroxyacetone kinase, L subunit
MTNVIEVIKNICKTMQEHKDYLTELDQPIGDSDHGINMARGFEAVNEKLDELKDKDIATILKTVGMTLVSTVGGASGPLYGSAFLKAAMTVTGKNDIDIDTFISMLSSAIEAVKQRGKATLGEATMLDAMIPSLEAMQNAREEKKPALEILKEGVEVAKEGAEHTKDLIATKGRASYVGERGLGHQDPGATSYTYLLEAIYESVKGD